MRSPAAISIIVAFRRIALPLSVLVMLLGCSTAENLRLVNNADIPLATPEADQVLELQPVPGSFGKIADLYVSPAGQLYIADESRHYIFRWDATGVTPQPIDSLGGRGSRTTQFDQPRYIDASNDLKIFISDRGNRRIQMFDRRFQFLGTVKLTGVTGQEQPYVPGPLGTNQLGELYFWDAGEGLLRKLTSGLQVVESFMPEALSERDEPVAIAITPNEVLVAFAGNGRIYRYSQNGRFAGFVTGFGQIRDIVWHNDRLYVLSDVGLFLLNSRGGVEASFRLNRSDLIRLAVGDAGILLTNGVRLFSTTLSERS